MDQKQIGEEVPPVLFPWRTQCHHFTVGPLENVSHLCKELEVTITPINTDKMNGLQSAVVLHPGPCKH